MQTIIVGHRSRIEWIGRLQRAIPGSCAIVDYAGEGAFKAHVKALNLAEEIGGRAVVIEDDAIPVVGFVERAEAWHSLIPDAVFSFYLGTGRPSQWQSTVDELVSNARVMDDDYIAMPRLLHGVCYSLPPGAASRILDRLRDYSDGVDIAIGRAWGKPVVYPLESLVEHRDDGSVERHPDGEPRNERRVARCLAGPLMYER